MVSTLATTLEFGQLIAIRPLGLSLVVGTSEQLARPVSWAHATEMVDPRPHLRSDEVVCTVGSALVDAISCSRFVEAVAAADAAGICLGLGEVHTQAPRALVNQCEKLGVVLTLMSRDVPFLAINDVLAEFRLHARSSDDTRDGELMTTLLEALRAGSPAAEMVDIAARKLGGRLEYCTENASYSSGEAAKVAAGAPAIPAKQVSLNETDLILWTPATGGSDSSALAQIGRIVQIAQREQDARESDHRARIGQLITLVADGLAHISALAPELESHGLPQRGLTVSAWPAGMSASLSHRLPKALVADTDEATFVISTNVDAVRETAAFLTLVCGYSSVVSMTDLARGLIEARATLHLARNRGTLAGPESLTTWTSLLEQQSRSRLMPFADQLVRPLLAPGVRSGPELVATLRSYLAHSGSIQATADEQFLHVNTVRHRLRRISEVLGRNPLDFSEHTNFIIAIWVFDRFATQADIDEPRRPNNKS